MGRFYDRLKTVVEESGNSMTWLSKRVGMDLNSDTVFSEELVKRICCALEVTPSCFDMTVADLLYLEIESEPIDNVIGLYNELFRLWEDTKKALTILKRTWSKSCEFSRLLPERVEKELKDSFKYNYKLIKALPKDTRAKELAQSHNALLSDFIDTTENFDMVWFYIS